MQDAVQPIKRIILVYNTASYLYRFRKEFIGNLQAMNCEVLALVPFDDFVSCLEKLGVRCIDLPISQQRINPFEELKTMSFMYGVFSQEKPDAVFNYTIKPVIYGSLAARAAGIKRIYSMVPGLGYVFMDTTKKQRLIKRIVMILYRFSLKYNHKVFFQNQEDRALFYRYGLVDVNKGVIVSGSGVNVEEFTPREQVQQSPVFLLASRLLWDKGIGEYVEAARRLRSKYPAVEFRILGPYDDNPSCIKPEYIERWQKEGIIHYLGATSDVRPFLAEASVFVLPSSYREGVPRSILEAMAMGLPIITADAPGCRETVRDGENGFLVAVKDIESLVKAMEKFILQPELIAKMGGKSRQIAEERFDVRKVNAVIIENMSDV